MPRRPRNFLRASRVPFIDSESYNDWRQGRLKETKEQIMDGTIIGLVAVIMSLGIPLGAMYTFYRVRQLRTEERLAAIAKGVSVPMEPELSQAARSRRAGILLTCGPVAFIAPPASLPQTHPHPATSTPPP